MPVPLRASDVFIAEDIRRNLRSIAATHEATRHVYGGGGDYAAGYGDGFIDGLRAIAEALGIHFAPGQGNTALGVRWE